MSKKRREDKKHIRELSQQLERQHQQAKVEKEKMRQKVIEQQRKTELLYQKLEEVGWDTDNHALQELQNVTRSSFICCKKIAKCNII